MSNPVSAFQSSERACPHCGQKFSCGLSTRDEQCWCFSYPRIISASDASHEGCLCPACLQKLIETIQKREQASAGG